MLWKCGPPASTEGALAHGEGVCRLVKGGMAVQLQGKGLQPAGVWRPEASGPLSGRTHAPLDKAYTNVKTIQGSIPNAPSWVRIPCPYPPDRHPACRCLTLAWSGTSDKHPLPLSETLGRLVCKLDASISCSSQPSCRCTRPVPHAQGARRGSWLGP